jgi:hypothetical protein
MHQVSKLGPSLPQNLAGPSAGLGLAGIPNKDMALHELMRCFTRDADGAWTCIAPCTLEHPKGRIQVAPGARFTPGTIFMGVDLARWLDEQRPK